jgi:DNA polymerase-3 subunit alpha
MYAALDRLVQAGNQAQRDKRKGQETLFSAFHQDEKVRDTLENLPDVEEWHEADLMANEKAALGFYLTTHPLARVEETIRKYSNTNALGLPLIDGRKEVCIGGLVTSVRARIDKKGNRMAFVSMEDLSGSFRAVAFSEAYARCGALLTDDAIVFLKGKVDQVGDNPTLRVADAVPVEQADATMATGVTINLRSAGLEDEQLAQLRTVFINHPGTIPVILNLKTRENGEVQIRADRALQVTPDAAFIADVEAVLGEGHMQLHGIRNLPLREPAPAPDAPNTPDDAG